MEYFSLNNILSELPEPGEGRIWDSRCKAKEHDCPPNFHSHMHRRVRNCRGNWEGRGGEGRGGEVNSSVYFLLVLYVADYKEQDSDFISKNQRVFFLYS